MSSEQRPWQRVEPPAPVNGALAQVLSSVDALREAWIDAINLAGPSEFQEARRRSLRRHAIETGIIERLYDVDWGVTEALVAEGLTVEVAAREGGVNDDALATIRSQFDALTFLAQSAREGRDLSVYLIRELHIALCRQQLTYEAHNALGQFFQAPLHHGEWKKQPNHVRRPDGTVMEYVPPDHVQSEMDQLVAFYQDARDLHPLVRAAWLHHAFILIHPFEDGNGRVARALTLLVLLQSNYAPLVVDRFSRGDYLAALDLANDGDPRELVRLFCRLEIVALRSELEMPAQPTPASGAADVARAYVERLRLLQKGRSGEKAAGAEQMANQLQERINADLEELGTAVHAQFALLDEASWKTLTWATPPEDKASWWAAQVYRAAARADFFVNRAAGTWWSYLKLVVQGWTLRYVAVIQKVGRGETGVLALTAFAEAVPPRAHEGGDGPPSFVALLETTEAESATFVYTEDIDVRHEEIRELLDRTLAAAVAHFAGRLEQ